MRIFSQPWYLASPCLPVRPAASAADAFGVWKHPENGSLVRMYKCGGGLCAKVVKVRDPSRKDVTTRIPSCARGPWKASLS